MMDLATIYYDFFTWFGKIARRMSFDSRKRIAFYRSLHMMQNGGAHITSSMGKIREIYATRGFLGKHVMVQVADEALAGLRAGKSVADSLSDWLPLQEKAILDAAERAGSLLPAYQKSISIIKQQKEMFAAVIAGISYPAILAVVALIGITIIASELLPVLTAQSDPETWGPSAQMMYVAITVAVAYWWIFVGLGAVGIGLVVYSLGHWTGTLRIYFDRIPPWSIYRSIQGAIFLSTFAVLQRSGMRMQEALGVIRETASPWLRERIDATLYGVRQGYNFGRSLQNAGYDFPSSMAIPMIELFAQQARYDEALEQFSEEWLVLIAAEISFAAKVAFYIGLFLMAVIVAGIALGMMELMSQQLY